jgi:hypothetical protein
VKVELNLWRRPNDGRGGSGGLVVGGGAVCAPFFVGWIDGLDAVLTEGAGVGGAGRSKDDSGTAVIARRVILPLASEE